MRHRSIRLFKSKKLLSFLVLLLLANGFWLAKNSDALVFWRIPGSNPFPAELQGQSKGFFSLSKTRINGIPIRLRGLAVEAPVKIALMECSKNLKGAKVQIEGDAGSVFGASGSSTVIFYACRDDRLTHLFRLELDSRKGGAEIGEENSWIVEEGDKHFEARWFESSFLARQWIDLAIHGRIKNGMIVSNHATGSYMELPDGKAAVIVARKK